MAWLAFGLQITGQTPATPAGPAAPALPSLTSIKGRVSNPDGQPVSSIQVLAVPIGSRGEGRQFGPGGGLNQATTDEQGNFEIKGLRQESYYLSASSPGYVTMPPTDDSGSNIYRVGDTAQITLVKGGVITGEYHQLMKMD
jgi:hypothetical protein